MYPASFAQRRLWFLAQLEESSAVYNMPVALRFTGDLNVSALRAALGDVVVRHESLRTVFAETNGDLQQVVLDESRAVIELPVRAVPGERPADAVADAAARPFDLRNDLPIRAELFHLGGDQWVLLLVIHHIAGDGWSFAPLTRDVMAAYEARCAGRAPGWEPLEIQYVDYTLWQRELLGDEKEPDSRLARQVAFWRRELDGLPDQLVLPTDRPRPPVPTNAGAIAEFAIDARLHQALADLARRNGATLFMVMQAALATLLNRLGAGTDIPVGSAVAGRTDEA